MQAKNALRPREVHLRLTPALHAALAAFAGRSSLGINAAARLLLERGLALEAEGGDLVDGRSGDFRLLGQMALANLTASEASLLILEKSFNVGYNRIDNVDALAAARARLRLRQLEEATEAEVLC